MDAAKELYIKILRDSNGKVPEQYKHIVDAIGIEATIALCDYFGGGNFYAPTLKRIAREAVKDQVNREYNGSNSKGLATKYGFSCRSIDYMVHSGRDLMQP